MSEIEPCAYRVATLPLRGRGGEPVDWRRTLTSHGVAALPPNRIDQTSWNLTTTWGSAVAPPRRLSLVMKAPGVAEVRVEGELRSDELSNLVETARHVLRLDDDLTHFYELVADDPNLAWVASGAGRMLRSPTVFEDVVKTICTTNCSWSGTERMVGALVTHLGQVDPHGGRAFPTAEAMARAGLDFYRDQARCGYRGPYLRSLACAMAEGQLNLENLNDPDLPDAEVATRLLALPGVGPYATAHIMLTSLGRYGLLILDSWTRPTFAHLSGREASDQSIRRRFRKFGSYQGLAFWLYLTKNWVVESGESRSSLEKSVLSA
ncbi:MAG TPA: hypothetical protein VMV12_06480 [Candidatus Micrarchaeaceae archaeon]|nr:hypothetical protein [Candidatus Micrarchaeaceae archaeon]